MATALVIDDFKAGQRLVKAMLKYTCDVVTMDSAEEAIAYALENPVNLIITDIDMPDMDGIEFCRFVKENDVLHMVPVIMLTAHHSNHTRYASMEAGADGYLTKPVSKPELVKVVERMLENPRATAEMQAIALGVA